MDFTSSDYYAKNKCPGCGSSKNNNYDLCVNCALELVGGFKWENKYKKSEQKNKTHKNTESKESKNYPKKKRLSKEVKMGKILELKGKVSWNDIKKNYKRLMSEYHPDKVSHLGSEIKLLSKKKTVEIRGAYDYFKEKYGE